MYTLHWTLLQTFKLKAKCVSCSAAQTGRHHTSFYRESDSGVVRSHRSRGTWCHSPVGLRSGARNRYRTDSTLIHTLVSTPGLGRVGVVMSSRKALDSGSRNAHKTPAIFSLLCSSSVTSTQRSLRCPVETDRNDGRSESRWSRARAFVSLNLSDTKAHQTPIIGSTLGSVGNFSLFYI